MPVYSAALSNVVNFYTITVTAATFTIPIGAIEIFINNIGAGNASWKGNIENPATAIASSDIILKAGASFAYGYVGRPRAPFTIDATATIVEISVTF